MREAVINENVLKIMNAMADQVRSEVDQAFSDALIHGRGYLSNGLYIEVGVVDKPATGPNPYDGMGLANIAPDLRRKNNSNG